MDKIKLNFQVDPFFTKGIERLQNILPFEQGDGIAVTAIKGDRAGVSLKDGKATIYYHKNHYFFRALGLLTEHAQTKNAFDISEDTFFEELSIMIDTSRCAVPTVDGVNKMIDYMALMGYSMAMLYTEDTVTVKGYDHLGYMRGRYSPEELRAMDDYAFEYGMEMIPCLECYGHMEKYLMWPEASPIKDTANVLLAREEKTFVFLDALIGQVSSCFRSKRIHIGMDEAWDMGRGAFFDKHGYVPTFEIFAEYMEKLVKITDKYGLIPMMWSDMYFRTCAADHRSYCLEETEILPEVAAKIPPQVELVFWHYGEKNRCDDYMLKKHKDLGRKTIFAGGLWSWIGHFPENHYVMETSVFSLNACRNNDVREAMMTLWLNDNAECDLFANLFGLSFFAELCYDKDVTDEKLRARFEAVTGGNYDAFLAMSSYHNNFDGDVTYANFHDRFFGKPLFWQDILEGLYDANLYKKPMAGHYAAYSKIMQQFAPDRFSDLYDFAAKVFSYLSIKSLIAEKIAPAYKEGDKEILAQIAEVLLPQLKKEVATVHTAHKALWMKTLKDVGWCNMDYRYAGVAARCDTAQELIRKYLSGEIPVIYALEEVRLPRGTSGFNQFSRISTPNLKV